MTTAPSDPAQQAEAAAQLAVLRSDRERLAERVRQPGWYAPTLGLLLRGTP